MRPVERQTERVHRIEIEGEDAYPFLSWLFPLLRWFHIDEFPAGPFLIVCAIVGGVANFMTGTWFLKAIHRYEDPVAVIPFALVGAGLGIALALKFITWLADHSPD